MDYTLKLVMSQGLKTAIKRHLLVKRRINPRDDFLGTLVNAANKEGGFTEDEVIGNALLLLLAGHVAVRNLIGNAIYLLLSVSPRGRVC